MSDGHANGWRDVRDGVLTAVITAALCPVAEGITERAWRAWDRRQKATAKGRKRSRERKTKKGDKS